MQELLEQSSFDKLKQGAIVPGVITEIRQHEVVVDIGGTMPELVPPSFEREPQDDGSSILHYRSSREGLAPMVIGLVKGLAKRYDVEIDVQHLGEFDRVGVAAAIGRSAHEGLRKDLRKLVIVFCVKV